MATPKHTEQEVAELRAELARRSSIVDLAGIARHMRVDRKTPQQWRQRGILPPVDFPEITEPIWYTQTIKDFAERTGRLWRDDVTPRFTASGKLVA